MGVRKPAGQADVSRKIEGLIKEDKSEVAEMTSSGLTKRVAYEGINRIKTRKTVTRLRSQSVIGNR